MTPWVSEQWGSIFAIMYPKGESHYNTKSVSLPVKGVLWSKLREKRDNIFPNDNCVAPHGDEGA